MNGTAPRKAGLSSERTCIVIVADDYQFLDTLHAGNPAVSYEWLLANTREQLLGFAAPAPLAFVVDLQMQSMNAIAVLELIGSLKLPSKIVLLSGADMRALAKAKSLAASLSLDVIGTLGRPLAMNKLMGLLTPYAQKTKELNVTELQDALEGNQLLLHYQPIIRREEAGWAVRGAEALVRWRHPQRGLLYPGQFLRLAEENGLMGALADFVMTEAIRQAGEWEKQGLDLVVGINLAASTLHDMGFLDRLLSTTRKYRVPPAHIMIEMIEAASLKDREALSEMLTRLRLHGVGLSLDDFGTGYSSLTELYRLPFTELKIDRTMINDIPHSREAATVIQGIIDLAHRLSIHVCAEGVETTEAFAFLEDAGCDAVQGVLIAKAGAAEEVENLMHRWSKNGQSSLVAAS